MFNDFLSSLLQVVIVVDVVGVVAYFLLTALRPRQTDTSQELSGASAPSSGSRPWTRPAAAGTSRLRALVGRVVPGRARLAPATTAANLEDSFSRLRRVLYSYQEGLA